MTTTEKKADWCKYRWEPNGVGICITTEDPHKAFGLNRSIPIEYRGTVHHCTEAKAREVLMVLNV